MDPDIIARLARVGVSPADVEERFVRGSGPGGQKINKTSSTVTLRHDLTGVEVRCQEERSQAANRERAWQQLCARLERRAQDARLAEQDARETERRRNRPKSYRQKRIMFASKQRRAKTKSARGRVSDE